MKIIDYQEKYQEEVKALLLELQEYISSLDREGYNIVTPEFKKKYFLKVMQEVKENNGKILLASDDNQIVGLIVGVINNETESTYDFKVPKRGRITELIVTNKIRSKGVGTSLLNAMETYFKSIGCEDVILGVFGYNMKALSFYHQKGYHNRYIDVCKKI